MDTALEAALALRRLLPRLETRLAAETAGQADEWRCFRARLEAHFPRLFALLVDLYGGQIDFYYHLEALLESMARAWLERPAGLKQLDARREARPDWFQDGAMLGAVAYVDRFAGDLEGIRARIPYFQELGLTYLHLMPLFACPPGENDGGYAVSSYRQVDPRLGSMGQLSALAAELREAGISLVLDFVFNHTSDGHEWALQARAGDPDARACYLMFPDRAAPDAYERTLREIFPEEHPGAFTFFPELDRWVWTTFHSYQWDLNYANPDVFVRMAGEMLFLANAGVEVLRLDAVAFLWKQMGTSCENLPQAHRLIQAFNAVARIAAPALLFKSEAIVHPDEVARYISPEECPLSYNPLLMALLWEALATRQVKLLNASLRERLRLPPGCAWVNYVRCHDDIGWTFSDEDARAVGIDGWGHRRFLNEFYTGRFPGSFARGLPFQENPRTGDCRVTGTCASLAGLEKALSEETAREVELAARRILLIHGIIMTIGGLPLLYLGDELATLNDYAYRDDPAAARDSRWVHRPVYDLARWQRRGDLATVEGRVYAGLRRLAEVRRAVPELGGQQVQVLDSGDERVFAYLRPGANGGLLALANFSESERRLPAGLPARHGLRGPLTDLISGEPLPPGDLLLEPYRLLLLRGE